MERIIDQELTLLPYFPNEEVALAWYQDLDVCKQVDNIDHPYSLSRLQGMYTYLSTHGSCFYISYCGTLVGDVSLQDNGEIAIVICKEYQNRHIGRRCVQEILRLAEEKGFSEVTAVIYSFNTQSRKMFEAVGFEHITGEKYRFSLNADEIAKIIAL